MAKRPVNQNRRDDFLKVQRGLDSLLLDYYLIGSYDRYKGTEQTYPFLNLEALKPTGATKKAEEEEEVDRSMGLHNHSLVFLYEGSIPESYKDQIRCWDGNRVTLDSLKRVSKRLRMDLDAFDPKTNLLPGNTVCQDLIRQLSDQDYGLMIQFVRGKGKYALTHFRVKIEEPAIRTARLLAKSLGYAKNTRALSTRKGGLTHDQVLSMLCRCYGFHSYVSGRREAAITAAEILQRQKRNDFVIYAGSQEARTLTRITRSEISKYVLLKAYELDEAHRAAIVEAKPKFEQQYVHDGTVCVYRVTYTHTDFARPYNGLRDFNLNVKWLDIVSEHLMPLKDARKEDPIPIEILRSKT